MKNFIRNAKIVGITMLILFLVSACGAVIFIYSGIYDIAASRPHTELVRSILLKVKRQSVKYHARNLEVPDLNNAELIQRGFILYRQQCVTCHGAPGEARSRIGIGVNPNPPYLEKSIEYWTEAEIAWVIANGLKMAGMPAFKLGQKPEDIWALTAFVKRMNRLSPQEYRQMKYAAEKMENLDKIPWLAPETDGREWLIQYDKQEGRKLIRQHGCAACHVIPGFREPRGNVGPPLLDWKKRHYISGGLINTPNNFVRWIRNPQHVDADTAMPDLGITEEEAKKIAAFLYSLTRH